MENQVARNNNYGENILLVKKMLGALGYLILDRSDSLDRSTSMILKSFQNDNGLRMTGGINDETLNLLERLTRKNEPVEEIRESEPLPTIEPSFQPMPPIRIGPPTQPMPSIRIEPMARTTPSARNGQTAKVMPPAQPIAPIHITPVPVFPNLNPTPASSNTSRPILRQGDSGDYVKQLQDSLNRLGYLAGTPDGLFGSRTADAVRRFQSGSGLATDGIVGPVTWAALDKAVSELGFTSARPTLRIGSTGLRVKELQLRLITMGYAPGAPDGMFGAQTDNAVKAFQTANNLAPDGVVGPQTWNTLDNAFSANPAPPSNVPLKTLRLGDIGDEVRLLQEKLRILGFYGAAIDGIFGPVLNEAVKNFQRAYGLTVDGIVGPVSWAILDEATTPTSSVRRTVKEGDTGDDVLILQEKLKFLGYFPGTVTGSFGPETTLAVMAFQRASGLTVDAVVGARTWAALFEQSTTPPTQPAPPPPGGGARPTLRLGDSGPYVSALQQELKTLMFYAGEVSGYFDAATELAVKTFQDTNRLIPDGIVGRSTWNALISLFPPPVTCV